MVFGGDGRVEIIKVQVEGFSVEEAQRNLLVEVCWSRSA